MKIGVTGTRSGMNPIQTEKVLDFLKNLFVHGSQLHHGDCVGVDVEVAKIAKSLGYRIVCHPPIKNDLRGYFESDEYREPLSYFARNRNIVDETNLLIVVPYQNEHQNNGGTWYTHDYGLKKKKRVEIFYPNPKISLDNFSSLGYILPMNDGGSNV